MNICVVCSNGYEYCTCKGYKMSTKPLEFEIIERSAISGMINQIQMRDKEIEQQAEVIASQKLLIDILKKSLNTALKDIVQQDSAINLATESLKRIKQRCAEDHRKANGSCLEESIRTLTEIKKLLTPTEGEK